MNLSIVKDRCIDFPYQSWKLRCVDNEKAYLDLQGTEVKLTEISYIFLKHYFLKNKYKAKDSLLNSKLAPIMLLCDTKMNPNSLILLTKR